MEEEATGTTRALDPRFNRDALGARVILSLAGQRQYRTVSSGYSYLSSSPPVAHFGLGDVAVVERLEVIWPDGLRESFPVESVDRDLTVERGAGEPLL